MQQDRTAVSTTYLSRLSGWHERRTQLPSTSPMRSLKSTREFTKPDAPTHAVAGAEGHSSFFPDQMVVPFQVTKLRCPREVWRSDPSSSAPESQALDAWAVPLAGESLAAYDVAAVAIAWAEGYGGVGVGSNGGAGRTGQFGALQVKGIGPTPLIGRDQSYFHSYGGACLEEALLEAIWSRVLKHALPLGSVDVTRVLTTGTLVKRKYPRSGKSECSPRALVYRAPTWRWGHAMRSVWFRPVDQSLRSSFDVERTKVAIEWLGSISDKQLLNVHDVLDLVKSAVECQALQVGAARGSRIMHGSLTPSNMSWDGRWLDFAGGASTVSDFGRLILPRGAPDFLNEEQLLRESLPDFCFYLDKYHPNAQGIADAAGDLQRHLTYTVAAAFRDRLLRLSGFAPEDIPGQKTEGATDAVREILATMSLTPFTVLKADNDAIQSMPASISPVQLNGMWMAAAVASSPYEGSQDVAEEILTLSCENPVQRSRWHEALRQYCAYRSKAVTSQQRERALFDSIRWNLPCHQLYRTTLYVALEDLVDQWQADSESSDLLGYVRRTEDAGLLHCGQKAGVDWAAVARSVSDDPCHSIAPKLACWIKDRAAAE